MNLRMLVMDCHDVDARSFVTGDDPSPSCWRENAIAVLSKLC